MSDTTDELAKVKQSLASIRAALRSVGGKVDDAKGYHFFRSWVGRTDELAGFVEEVASQVRYLAANVETICQIIEKNDSSRSG